MMNNGDGDSKHETEELQKVNDNVTENHHDLKYNARKPKWWLQQRNRRGTKGQRRVMTKMKHYIIPPPLYGETLDWNETFDSCRYKDIWLELGFGLGDNLLRNAQVHPDKGMVGAEVHPPGTAHVLKIIQKAQQEGRYWDGYSLCFTKTDDLAHEYSIEASEPISTTADNIYSNVRVYRGNGMKLVNSIPTCSVSAILIAFPDPFPKQGHEEFRLLQRATATDFYRALRAEGRIYLATDHEEHFEWCSYVMSQCRDLFILVTPVPDRSTWLPVISKYEQKGLEEGREAHMACWQVVGKSK